MHWKGSAVHLDYIRPESPVTIMEVAGHRTTAGYARGAERMESNTSWV